MHLSLGHGELLELPITSREGPATALLFENIPGGDLEVLADIRYDEDADRSIAWCWKSSSTTIRGASSFDERFCQRVARERHAFVQGVSDWTNMILNPEPHVVELLGAMAQSKPLCDAYARNFNHPDRQWEALATPERTAAFIARHRRDPATRPQRTRMALTAAGCGGARPVETVHTAIVRSICRR